MLRSFASSLAFSSTILRAKVEVTCSCRLHSSSIDLDLKALLSMKSTLLCFAAGEASYFHPVRNNTILGYTPAGGLGFSAPASYGEARAAARSFVCARGNVDAATRKSL